MASDALATLAVVIILAELIMLALDVVLSED